MASGGMGDVLAGVTAALVAQGLPNDQALQCAVCVHGEAADLAAAESGQRGMLATDLLPLIRQLLNPDL
jgi:NAD(P)H-hydrate epimerase